MGFRIDGKIYNHKIVLIKADGSYEIDSMKCCALIMDPGLETLQFPRSIVREGSRFALERFDIKKEVVFYKYYGAAK